METVALKTQRYTLLGPCPSGFIWFDRHTERYQEFGPDIDPNEPPPQRARQQRDYKAGWRSR